MPSLAVGCRDTFGATTITLVATAGSAVCRCQFVAGFLVLVTPLFNAQLSDLTYATGRRRTLQ